MDDGALRTLATRLRADLAAVVADAGDRARISTDLDAALTSDPLARDALLDVINGHASTRRWYAEHAPVPDDVDRSYSPLPGSGETIGLYYVCPQGDHDKVLLSAPRTPPRCPVHGIEMITED
jgi:hypothetical protein